MFLSVSGAAFVKDFIFVTNFSLRRIFREAEHIIFKTFMVGYKTFHWFSRRTSERVEILNVSVEY